MRLLFLNFCLKFILVPQSLQSVPLMKSSHTCDQDISSERKLLQSSSCQEIHVVRPFSKASNGAVTEVSQKLVFVKDAVGVQTRKGAMLIDCNVILKSYGGECNQ